METLHAYHKVLTSAQRKVVSAVTSAALVKRKLKTGMPQQAQDILVIWPG